MTENGTSMYMPVAPAYAGMGNGNGMFGNDGWWIILLLLVFGGRGWGFGGGNGGDGNEIQRGFDQSAVMNGVSNIQNAVTTGFGNVQTALCNGFAGVANGFAQAEIANNARQIADMQQNFASQTAMMQGFNGLQSQFADCCCENRTTSMQNTRDIIENQNRVGQSIIDKLCALELDGVKNQLAQAQRENVGLQNQLNMATLRESQTAQNAFIAQGLSNEVDALYNRLNNCPVPSMPVYGRTPIFTCNGNNGNTTCPCGNNAFMN